eukprot:1711249-Alexandrium_andersonii.AAC.1
MQHTAVVVTVWTLFGCLSAPSGAVRRLRAQSGQWECVVRSWERGHKDTRERGHAGTCTHMPINWLLALQ